MEKSSVAPSGSENPEPNTGVQDSRHFSQGIVSITFDDGWRTTYSNAFPILDSVGYKATAYIISGRINNPDFVGAGEIRSLEARGHEIGAHTRTHRDLTLMTVVQIREEVSGSRLDLLNLGIRRVATFAYPFGSYNQNVVREVRDVGFGSARSTNGGSNVPVDDRFILKRENLGGSISIERVKGWVDSALTNRTWLILVAHHVDDSVSDFSIDPQFFRDIVDYLVTKKARVVTITEGAAMMSP